MYPPAGIELVARMSRLNLRLRLIAAFAAGVLAVGCGAFVADPGYRATQLPDDVTELFEVQQVVANPDADTVWIFEQGGPSHEISNDVLFAFLRYRGHEDIHLVQAHQTLTLNPRLAARHARLTRANLQAEVDVSVELLRRVIDHFKAQHKHVVVVGYSYGSFLVARYLALHGPDGADRYLLMAGRLDMPTDFVNGALEGMLYHFPNTVDRGAVRPAADHRPGVDQTAHCRRYLLRPLHGTAHRHRPAQGDLRVRHGGHRGRTARRTRTAFPPGQRGRRHRRRGRQPLQPGSGPGDSRPDPRRTAGTTLIPPRPRPDRPPGTRREPREPRCRTGCPICTNLRH